MFYLFAGYSYYPEGGVFDFQGYSPTLKDAKTLLDGLRDMNHFDWWHITNEQMVVVASSFPAEVTV